MLQAASATTSHTPRVGDRTDHGEEERLDSSLKEMFEADSTRMLLLYRLPPDAVVKATRPDWGRIVRNVPEYHNMAAGNKKKKKSGGTNQNEGRPRTQPPPRGRFNADIDNYEDGPVSHPGRQAAVLKDCDSEFAKAKKVRVYSLPALPRRALHPCMHDMILWVSYRRVW